MNGGGERLRTGDEAHKQAFCRFFLDTHDPYRPEDIAWPSLDPRELERLRGLPVWNQAVKTETYTALKVQTLGRCERDPLLREAIALQGFEEGRHARVLELLTEHYGIQVEAFADPAPPSDPTWAFLRTGYGECMDSFFAFGLFEIGKNSRFFPHRLIDIFEPVIQEEARHILFLVNWAAYLRAGTPLLRRPLFDLRRSWCIVSQAFDHLRLALDAKSSSQEGFTMNSRSAFGDVSARSFLELCLTENDRRLAPYDRRLLRPVLVPRSVRAVLRILPGERTSPAPGSP